MISANGGLPAHRYTPQVTPRWPRGSEPASRGTTGSGSGGPVTQERCERQKRGGERAGERGAPQGTLAHIVIVKPLWRALQDHTVAPEAMAHRLLRRMVEHLQERMACRETQLEARAEDMSDPVTKRV